MARVLRFFRTSASAKLQHKIYYENEKRTFCKNYLDCVRDDGVAGGGNPFPEKSEECVAARALFVHFCCTRGVPTCAIRDYLGRKRNDCIAHYNSTYNVFHHSSAYFRGLAMEIERKLCEKESGCPE